jgi:NitT/TauT family transport system ATP-binding protein
MTANEAAPPARSFGQAGFGSDATAATATGGLVFKAGPSPVLEARQVGKRFVRDGKTLHVLAGLTMALRPGEFAAIIGPSGCGKSTLLKILAGLTPYDSGQVRVMGALVDSPRPEVGFMFQGLALLSWRNVLQNVLLPAELVGMDKGVASARARRCIDLVGLKGFEKFHLREISGGMRQRVALARMLMMDARLLLLDEPFSSLDELTRETIDLAVMDICLKAQTSYLMVTHSIYEAVLMSDKVFVMCPAPATISGVVEVCLAKPRTREVTRAAEFMAAANEVREILEGSS